MFARCSPPTNPPPPKHPPTPKRFFNADPAEYSVVFTRSATEALKIVGETFPWGGASEFAYLRENHNSVLGVREYATAGGGRWVAARALGSGVGGWGRGRAQVCHVSHPLSTV